MQDDKAIQDMMARTQNNVGKNTPQSGDKLQSVPTPSRKGISKGQLLFISACAISVLLYKYSKGNKEFKAFLGLLSPFILFYGISRYNIYKKRKEMQEYQSRGLGFNNA